MKQIPPIGAALAFALLARRQFQGPALRAGCRQRGSEGPRHGRRTRFLAFVLLAAALLAPATPAEGQPNRPIYPVYEGYVPNDDGTAVLVFGYYNHNSVAVEIQPGESNGFDPGPADRGQPTVFEPGRQRNVCLLVLPQDYEGNLAWTLTWAGQEQTTTERGGVDPLYLIENISMAYHRAKQIDAATTERGVCVEPDGAIRATREPAVRPSSGVRLAPPPSPTGSEP